MSADSSQACERAAHGVEASDGIHQALKTLLLDDRYADMTIRCGNVELKAHRAIVCTQSSFFAKAMDGPFRESIAGVVELPEDYPEIVVCLLQFLYAGNYIDAEHLTLHHPAFTAEMSAEEIDKELADGLGVDTNDIPGGSDDDRDWEDETEDPSAAETRSEPPEEYLQIHDDAASPADGAMESKDDNNPDQDLSRPDTAASLFTSLRVYVLADKCDVPALKLLARERFWVTASHVFETYADFPAVVDELYETTAPGDFAMREIPCRLIANRYQWDGPLATAVDPVLAKHGDLALGVLKYMQIYTSEATRVDI
ncbi:hypothetical protein S7711_04422 [Stachybotrys chartarum IBT 7711]|uniref:BTB domain-containing protein n=1 Tax=Stachybotrys chartarum (strain CBS 109288 / IBT 7711) TaxID=1280523 RepID=A0A084B5K9_STACB|nr:hypothetical protein S7711_04422 [Stachybotrys chartarum IBT 7711]